MAKEIKAKIKLQLEGGKPSQTKLGPALGQHQVNIGEFVKKFKMQTSDREGQTVPVEITVYTDRSFTFVTKTPPASELILKKAGLPKGSSKPQEIVGSITWKDVEEVAKIKMSDLNAHSMEQAKKIIAGSARSMGIEVVE